MRYTDDQSLPENLGRRGGTKIQTPVPSPAEIAEAAERIRQEWSPAGRRNRHYMGEYRVRSLKPLTVDACDTPTSS